MVPPPPRRDRSSVSFNLLFFCLTLLQLLHLLDLAAVGLHLSLFDSTRKNEDTGRENKGKQKERARKREKLEKVRRERSEQKEKKSKAIRRRKKNLFSTLLASALLLYPPALAPALFSFAFNSNMNLSGNAVTSKYSAELIENAAKLVRAGRGILAADESTGTIGKRVSFVFSTQPALLQGAFQSR